MNDTSSSHITPDPLNQTQRMDAAVLGRYRVRREIGRGFSSLVYEAHDLTRDRTVALKVLTLGQNLSNERRADMAERFGREARAISALSHPGIVSIYDIGQAGDGQQFIAMERLHGESLRACLEREGSLPPEEAVPLIAQIADALHYAHQRGIVHRDVKPDNIFILPGGVAKLMDFGVAHMVSEGALTQTGTVVGSPAYMSPEQISGQMLDGGSDVFSLGVTLAETLTGRKPFDAPTIPAVMNRILHRPPQMEGIGPRALRRVLARALDKNTVARYASAAAFAEALRRQVMPGLATVMPSSTVILSPPDMHAHRRGQGESLIGWDMRPPAAKSSRAAHWGGLLAGVAAVTAFALFAVPKPAYGPVSAPDALPQQASRTVPLTAEHVQTALFSPVWGRSRRPAVQAVPPQIFAPRPAPRVTATNAYYAPSMRPIPIVRPLLVVSPATGTKSRSDFAAPHVRASRPMPPVMRVAAARQEQTLPPPVPAPPITTIDAPQETTPRLLQKAEAVYPPQMKDMGVGGSVVVELSVSNTGRVREATVIQSSGVDDLDAAALDAVGNWRYAPARRGGQAVPATVTVRIDFPATP